MLKIFFISLFSILALGSIVYLLGPTPEYPSYDCSPLQLSQLSVGDVDKYVQKKEASVNNIKPDNEARVLWYDDDIKKTEYALVYLHGFSASHMEGDEMYKSIAQRYGMNAYLARLSQHGLDDVDAFKKLTPKGLVESAKEAVAIGATIGEKVILVSCSTGGTLSTMLAAEDDRVTGMIMYSPNISLRDPMASLVTYPWGKQLLKQVMGGEYHYVNYDEEGKKYWYDKYNIDGLLALQALIDDGMQSETFEKINIPSLVMCYYKDEDHQDHVVSVKSMDMFMDAIKTPIDQKRIVKLKDANEHVFITSLHKDRDFSEIKSETFDFVEEVLKIAPVSITSAD